MSLVGRVRAAVAAETAGDASGHDLDHLDRVARLGRTLAEAEGADVEVVELAAYLHDLHRVVERRAGHAGRVPSSACAPMVAELLAGAGGDDALLAPVLEAIEVGGLKAFAGDDVAGGSTEGRVLHDADTLDAMGAVGIGRAFMYGATIGQPMWEPGATLRDVYEPGATSSVLGHFPEKLLRLRDDMRTAKGRELAERRHEVLEAFVAEFLAEWAGEA